MENKYSKENLEKIVKESYSFADVCRYYGLPLTAGNYETIQNKIKNYQISTFHFKRNSSSENKGKTLYTLDTIFCKDSAYTQTSKLKNKLLKNSLKDYKCECCNNTEWMGEPIPLETHHIDGIKTNNDLSNLQLLCPNCHAFTDNYKGKNVKDKIIDSLYCNDCGNIITSASTTGLCSKCSSKKLANDFYEELGVTKESLKKLIRIKTFKDIGLMYNRSDNAIKKWCNHFNIPSLKKDIKRFSDEEWEKI